MTVLDTATAPRHQRAGDALARRAHAAHVSAVGCVMATAGAALAHQVLTAGALAVGAWTCCGAHRAMTRLAHRTARH